MRRELCDEIAVVTCERLHLSSPLRFRADVCVTYRHSLCVLYTVGFRDARGLERSDSDWAHAAGL